MAPSRALSTRSLPNYLTVDRPATPSEMRPISRDDMIIAVMGPTGSGKSTFINIATKSESAVVGDSLESCTQDIAAYGCRHPDGNRDVVFVDTPGFDDTNRSDGDILNSIAKWLVYMYKRKITLSGILYLHRISDNRMAGTPLRNLEVFRKLCGSPALSNVMLTTTLWGEVDETLGQRRETELVSVYWSSMIIAGSRVSRFERTYDSAWGIIDQFQHVPQPRPLLIQQEMVVQGKLLSQTSAGLTLLQWLTKFINEIRQAIRRIEAQLRSSTNDANVQTSTSIEEHKNHISVMEQQEKIIRTNDSTASDQAPLLVHNAIPNNQLQVSDSVSQSLPDNDSDTVHELPVQSPPPSDHASVEEPSPVNTAKTPLHINVHCAEDDNVNLRVVPPTATVLSDSASTSGESRINLIAFPTCPHNVSPTSVNSQILTSPTPPDVTPVTSASRTQIHWAHEHRFNAAQTLLSRHSDPTIPLRARLVSQVQRGKKVAQLRTPSQPQPPCGCPNKTAHNVVEMQAQGIAGSQVDVMMTEIREIRHDILQWMQDIRHAVSLYNSAWEWGGGLGIERMFLNVNGDFYNGCFHSSNIGGRNGINTVTSTTT